MRHIALGCALAVVAACIAGAQDVRFFRIGTGSASGSYFPIGGAIASAISNPPGSRECDKGGSCGVPGLLAAAQSTQGPVENIALIAKGSLDSGLAPADLAYWAFHGTGPYADKGAVKNLRAIANLYSEVIHVVVRANADIQSIRDLKLRRVSLGEQASGTLVNARAVLKTYGLSELDVLPFYLQPGPAADLLANDGIDAFFVNAGPPVGAIAELARTTPIRLLSIAGGEREELLKLYPFLSARIIPGGTYENVSGIETLGVGVQYLATTELDEKLVYSITRALWHPNTQKLWENVGPLAQTVKLESALDGLSVPLHPGAAQFYAEKNLAAPQQ
ncbi:MAG: TAXI family TRAP transporter solute-binding subunit [Alphaproteobacteria bacterium]|nr:TAXI family TRAP transporter solute-binding subunit [Alphaproteobacteria bacterium]